MAERYALTPDPKDLARFDFSEAALPWVEKLTLDMSATEEVVNGAQAEILRLARKLEFEHNKFFTEALRYVIDTHPRLFKLSRLEKTRSASAATVVAE